MSDLNPREVAVCGNPVLPHSGLISVLPPAHRITGEQKVAHGHHQSHNDHAKSAFAGQLGGINATLNALFHCDIPIRPRFLEGLALETLVDLAREAEAKARRRRHRHLALNGERWVFE
jgi:hypothetical protein